MAQEKHHADNDIPQPPDLSGPAGSLGIGVGLALLAAVLGAGLGWYLRRRDLAWTWSLPAPLLPAAILWALIVGLLPLSLSSGYALGIAAGFAIGLLVFSLHQRKEDRRAGGDREAAAASRRGVLDGPRRRFAERGGASRLRASGVPIGRTGRGELACVPRGSAASGCHVLVPGATGAGKTTTLGALLSDYVMHSGFGAVVIEAKSDGALLEAGRGAAAARGAPFRLVSPEGPDGYDPLASGEVDERSERLVAVQDWGSADADFYRQAASPFLRTVLAVLEASPGPVSLARAARYCDPDRLARLAVEEAPERLAIEVRESNAALSAEERRAIGGMGARLRNLASSQFASRWLDPEPLGDRAVNLRVAIAHGEVVYFRLDTDRTGHVGRAIAQMVLLDLGAAASAMMGRGVGTFVAIDEFGALEASALERLFTRGRGAGFSVALGTQTLADLSAAGSAVRERVGATVSALVCHRLGGQQDAEWAAQLIGTVPTWETTTRTDGWSLPTEQGTRTRGHRFEVHPADLQRLECGEAYLASLEHGGPRRSARVRVVPAWERLPATQEPAGHGPDGARRE
jgi:hypothetical protein